MSEIKQIFGGKFDATFLHGTLFCTSSSDRAKLEYNNRNAELNLPRNIAEKHLILPNFLDFEILASVFRLKK